MNKFVPSEVAALFAANDCIPLVDPAAGHTTYWHPSNGIHLYYSVSLVRDGALLKRLPDTVIVVPDDEAAQYATANSFPLEVIKIADLTQFMQHRAENKPPRFHS